MNTTCLLLVLAAGAPLAAQSPAAAASRYPFPPRPLPESEEIAIALSAAPEEVSSRADVYVLRGTDFVKARAGTNGCGCVVVRDLHEGSLYPICFDREGARTVMLREMKETSLRARGLSEAQVERAIEEAFAAGTLIKPARPSLAYMMSPKQVLFSGPDSTGRRVGAWYPHVMMTGVGLTAEQIGLLPGSRYRYLQAGGTPGTLHEFVALVAVWSDGTPAPPPALPRP
jgi:hypothetical protein